MWFIYPFISVKLCIWFSFTFFISFKLVRLHPPMWNNSYSDIWYTSVVWFSDLRLMKILCTVYSGHKEPIKGLWIGLFITKYFVDSHTDISHLLSRPAVHLCIKPLCVHALYIQFINLWIFQVGYVKTQTTKAKVQSL